MAYRRCNNLLMLVLLFVIMSIPMRSFASDTNIISSKGIENQIAPNDSNTLTSPPSTTVGTDENKTMTSRFVDWYMGNINYSTITLLMTIESSFIPFPSEVVLPPAAWKAQQDKSLNLVLIFLFGTLGALIGALINYYLSISLGRALVYKFADTKFAHILLINREKIEKAESYFIAHGKSSTFIGRLIPGIRQLISIPAGLAKMNIGTFIMYTFLGAGIWNVILIALGYFLYSQKELLNRVYGEIKIGLLIAGALFVLYLVISSLYKKKKQNKQKVD